MISDIMQSLIQNNLYEVKLFIAFTIFFELLTSYYLISGMIIGYKRKQAKMYHVILCCSIIAIIVLGTLAFELSL